MRFHALLTAVLLLPSTGSTAPPTPKNPVTDTYFGTSVRDDYRWLEDWSVPAVQAWSRAQNEHARAVLDAMPHYAQIQQRLASIANFRATSWSGLVRRGDTIFALENAPPKQQPFLVALRSPDDPASARVLVDPNVLDPKGGTEIDFFVPSLDGRFVAVSLSEGGSEAGSVSVWEVATARRLPDLVPRVNGGTAGGGLAWNADASGFFYTRYPRPPERSGRDLDFYQQVYFHRLDTPTDTDAYAIGKEFPKIAETSLASSDDGRFVLATVKNGDGGEAEQYLRKPDGSWTRIATLEDDAAHGRFGPDGSLYLISHRGAPRGRILSLPPGETVLARAVEAVPEGDAAIDDFRITEGRLYVAALAGGPSTLRVYDHGGKALGAVPLLPISAVTGLLALPGDALLFENQSDLVPPAWYRVGADGKVAKTALATASPVDFSDCAVTAEAAVSKDGTRVPLRIVHRKSLRLDSDNPTLLYGYGGYAISQQPTFDPMRKVWLEQGGVWAAAGLRGGGEWGEGWHRSGRRITKQNVFDDFIACARRLIEAKYTKPSRLAIEGGSNGGLLMGAAFTQHPELFAAVVSHVGIYDMLRYERTSNGEFNVTEFGSVKDPEQFRALYAYSPYHHVVDGTRYPPVLMLTGANDPRVDPSQSRKMTARLQAAAAGAPPILLRTSASSGHGIGSSLGEKVGEAADVDAFLFDRLGVAYRPVP